MKVDDLLYVWLHNNKKSTFIIEDLKRKSWNNGTILDYFANQIKNNQISFHDFHFKSSKLNVYFLNSLKNFGRSLL